MHFSDTRVRVLASDEAVLAAEAYVLFYARRSATTRLRETLQDGSFASAGPAAGLHLDMPSGCVTPLPGSPRHALFATPQAARAPSGRDGAALPQPACTVGAEDGTKPEEGLAGSANKRPRHA